MPGRHYATGHVNKALIALVPIRATDPVAIPVAHCLRVNPCNSWAIIFRGISVAPAKDNFKLSQVVLVVVIKQPLIALVPIRATDPVAIQSIETIRVNPCNSWAKKITSGHKLTSSQFNQHIHFVPQQSSSTTPQNSPADNQNLQHSSSGHNNTWQTSC